MPAAKHRIVHAKLADLRPWDENPRSITDAALDRLKKSLEAEREMLDSRPLIGSVGTTGVHKQIANDRLSTRGYVALLKAAFSAVPTEFAYVFTDWRMWVYLFDVIESSGFGVRSMIVWDKGSPGMGRGWRSQHELIMWGAKTTPPFDKHAPGAGNVVQAARSGNDLHTTQKPVELLERLLDTVPFAETLYDPFAGSGTSLIAADRLERRAFLMELDPGYCDVIRQRYEDYVGG